MYFMEHISGLKFDMKISAAKKQNFGDPKPCKAFFAEHSIMDKSLLSGFKILEIVFSFSQTKKM